MVSLGPLGGQLTGTKAPRASEASHILIPYDGSSSFARRAAISLSIHGTFGTKNIRHSQVEIGKKRSAGDGRRPHVLRSHFPTRPQPRRITEFLQKIKEIIELKLNFHG